MKYKNFLIKYNSYQSEIREWCGGHSSEGSGHYETVGGYEAIHLPSGKSTGRVFDDESTAKLWVDAYVKGIIIKQEVKLKKAIKKLEDKYKKIEQKRRHLDRQLGRQMMELSNKSSALRSKMPKTLT
jgi:hypothetical protein